MHRDVTADACNVRWSKNIFFNQAIPPIVANPNGIYMAPYLLVNLQYVMKEYDPHIRVAKIGDLSDNTGRYDHSSRYDSSNRSYGNEVLLPRHVRTYGVFNISTGENVNGERQLRCANRPMRIKNIVESTIDYEARPVLNDPIDISAKESNDADVRKNVHHLVLKRRDATNDDKTIATAVSSVSDGARTKQQPPPRDIKDAIREIESNLYKTVPPPKRIRRDGDDVTTTTTLATGPPAQTSTSSTPFLYDLVTFGQMMSSKLPDDRTSKVPIDRMECENDICSGEVSSSK